MKSILGRLSLRQAATAKEGQKVSWTELFFDLAFVVALSRLSHAMGDHTGVNEWLQLLAGGLSVMIAWMQVVFYANRFDTRDGLHQIVLLVQMFGVLVMSSGFREYGGALIDPDRFMAGLLVCRICLILLYLRAAVISPEARSLAIGISSFYTLTGTSYVVAGIDGIWFFGTVIGDILLPIILRPVLARSSTTLTNSHLVERFGLLIILMFGETLAATVNHSHPVDAPVSHWVFMLFAFVGMTSCWHIYTSNADENAVRRGFGLAVAWEITHVALVIGLAALSLALHFTLKDPACGTMLLYSYAGALGCIGLLHFWCCLAQPDRTAVIQAVIRLATAAGLAMVAWFEVTDSIFAPVVVIAISGVIQVLTDELL